MATLTYTRTFQTSEMRRMQCDGFRGSYVKMNWANSGYTQSGDTSTLETTYSNTVTITTQKVTATWFNNSGGCSYNFYVVLHTANGDYTSSTVNYEWPAGGGTNTLTFTIKNVVGEWTSFDIYGQNWTFSEKKTEYPYVYWFNNSAGTVTVKYVTASTIVKPTFCFVRVNNNWRKGAMFVWNEGKWIPAKHVSTMIDGDWS